jgi:hypothetical protein
MEEGVASQMSLWRLPAAEQARNRTAGALELVQSFTPTDGSQIKAYLFLRD